MRVWDALSSKRSWTPKDQVERDALNRYNEVMLCKRFHWTPDEIAALPFDFYQELMVIMNIVDSKEKSST